MERRRAETDGARACVLARHGSSARRKKGAGTGLCGNHRGNPRTVQEPDDGRNGRCLRYGRGGGSHGARPAALDRRGQRTAEHGARVYARDDQADC